MSDSRMARLEGGPHAGKSFQVASIKFEIFIPDHEPVPVEEGDPARADAIPFTYARYQLVAPVPQFGPLTYAYVVPAVDIH